MASMTSWGPWTLISKLNIKYRTIHYYSTGCINLMIIYLVVEMLLLVVVVVLVDYLDGVLQLLN